MIVNFLHRGLKRLFQRGEGRAFPVHHVPILEDILSRLDTAQDIRAMNLPAYHLHQLTGDFKGFWSITVSANYRVIFKFRDGHAGPGLPRLPWQKVRRTYHENVKPIPSRAFPQEGLY